MGTKRAPLLILAALASLPLACKDGGCGGGGNGGAPSATASASAALSASAPASVASASASSSAMAVNKMTVRAGGAVGALFRAASQLELKDEQKEKIEKIATDLRESDKAAAEGDAGSARKEMKGLHEEIVAGVKAGKIDTAKLESHYVALEKEAKERNTRDNEALAKLHAVLEPEQRKKIAADVKKNDDERAARMKTMEAAQAAHVPDGGRPSMSRRRYERYGRELDLDTDQKKKMDAIIPKDDPKAQTDLREETKKKSDAVLAAFEKDTFDAKGLPAPDTKRIRQPFDEQVKFYNGLLPILKPEQKDKLAARVEKQGGPGGPGGFGGRGEGEDHGRRRPGGGEHGDDDNKDDHEGH